MESFPFRSVPGAGPAGGEATGVQERGLPRRPHPLTLGDGNGLEAVQLFEQAAPLGGVQTVDEVARALRSVQRLHGLLLGVGAQEPGTAGDPERQQSPAAAAPRRRAGRGGRARPQAAHRPAPQQRQQPGHGVATRPPRQSLASDAAGQRLRSWAQPRPAPAPPDARPGHRAPCTRRARTAIASLAVPAPLPAGPEPGKTFCAAAGPGARSGEGGAGGRAGGCLPVEERRRGRAGSASVSDLPEG